MRVSGEDPEGATGEEEGWTVVASKKKRPLKVKPQPSVAEVMALEGARPQLKAAAPPAPKKSARRPHAGRVGLEVEALLDVAPHMRRVIVGPRGATLRQVQQEFPGVRVFVPPPLNTLASTKRLGGFRR